MSRDEDKLIRQLSLLSFLLSQPRPFTAREIQDSVEGYWNMSDETFARRFHGDRTDLAKVGIEISSASQSDSSEVQVYFLPEQEYRLPSIEFTPAEQRSLAVALAALEGRFAYARPLRLALTAITHGLPRPVQDPIEQLPVALAADEDARKAGKQLARLEDAATRGKTVNFSYTSTSGTREDRVVDPYSLFLIQGRWYVVGFDHARQGIRTFRLTRIGGTVRFSSEKTRDFVIPSSYDPDQYRARPPWVIGKVMGAATVKVEEELSWWVSRLQPHIAPLPVPPDAVDDDCQYFSMPFADEDVLLSWVVGLGGCGELLQPQSLRAKLAGTLKAVLDQHTGEPPAVPAAATPSESRNPAKIKPPSPGTEPISAEHLARAISLLQYLADERRPTLIGWEKLKEDLGLARREIEADLALINLVNFGGGTYAISASAGDDGVSVTRDMMADVFSRPARLSPLMTRALLLALDLLGDTIRMDGAESLASVREKVRLLAGSAPGQTGIVVDDVIDPFPGLLETINEAIREHRVLEIEYFTPTRNRLAKRLIEPYLLFRSRDGWYLEAFCLKADAQRTFRLELIRRATDAAESFAPRAEVDLTARFSGVAFPAGAVNWAWVRFKPRWRLHLEDRGIAFTALPGGDLRARVPYLDQDWMAREVVRFLGEATLDDPGPARERVHELAGSLLRIYSGERSIGPGVGT